MPADDCFPLPVGGLDALDVLADLVVGQGVDSDSDSEDEELGAGSSAHSLFSSGLGGLGAAEYGQGIGFGGTFGNGEWAEANDWDLYIDDAPMVAPAAADADLRRVDSRRSAAGNALWWLPTPAVSPTAAASAPASCAGATLGHKTKSMTMAHLSRSTSTALGGNSPRGCALGPILLPAASKGAPRLGDSRPTATQVA